MSPNHRDNEPPRVKGSKNASRSDSGVQPPKSHGLGLALLEFLALLAACWVFAGSLPPDVGESHYLCKAKRFWDDGYCRGDLFLDSPAPHWLFYITVGWLTKFCSLEATALVARAVAFAGLAFSWQRLNRSVFERPWISLLTGGLWLLGLHRLHMAGEWVVGGIEAKSFAYAFLFLGLASLARDRWPTAWLWFGLASAFHVLVGGWAVVAAGVPLVLRWKKTGLKVPAAEWLCLLVGGLVSLAGVIPGMSMNAGASPEESAQGHIIYTYVRLGHHLPFHRFEHVYMIRHGLLLIGTLLLAYFNRRDERSKRLAGWCIGTIVIAMVGIFIDQVVSRYHLATAASLLRFYFFRLSDMAVPLWAAFEIASLAVPQRVLDDAPPKSLPPRNSWLPPLVASVALGHLVYTMWEHRSWPIPPAIRPVALPIANLPPNTRVDVESDGDIDAPAAYVPRLANLPATQAWWQEWRILGEWAKSETEPDAMFLTPASQQTFKWYASRAEVGTWKDIPQDARGLIEWHRRMHDLIASEEADVSPDLPQGERLVALARKYKARYIVVDRTRDPTPPDPRAASRVYPPVMTKESPLAVYELRRLSKQEPRR